MQNTSLKQRFKLPSCTCNMMTILELLALARNHKGCTHYKTVWKRTRMIKHIYPGQQFPCFCLKVLSRKSSNTISTFRPPLPTSKAEQTSNQPQEHWLKPKLFSRSSTVKSRECTQLNDWQKQNCHNPACLTLLWQAAVQNAYFRHRNRSKCPNYLFSKYFPLAAWRSERTEYQLEMIHRLERASNAHSTTEIMLHLQGLCKSVNILCHILHIMER